MPLLPPVMTATFPSSFVMIFSPLESLSSRKGPKAVVWTIPSNRRAHALSGTTIRRKHHESVMSLVMNGKCCHRFAILTRFCLIHCQRSAADARRDDYY